MKKILMGASILFLALILGACSTSDKSVHESTTSTDKLTKAESPKYEVGTKVIINTDHMEGMDGAEGTVSGVYDTTIYSVNYKSSDGEEVKNHKWVIKEELEDSKRKDYVVGDEVILKNGHMSGMGGEGMKAQIVEVVQGPVYMVDYKPTNGEKEVKNHQWVVESELKADK